MTSAAGGQNYHSYSTIGLRKDMMVTAASIWIGRAASSRTSTWAYQAHAVLEVVDMFDES
eukprot:3189922-Pyramimonas_sp.AAC.1